MSLTKDPKPETLLTKEELARRLCVTTKTIEKYAKDPEACPGFPETLDLGPRQVRWRESEVNKFISNLGRRKNKDRTKESAR